MNDINVESNAAPYVRILEQPLSRRARFRYESEGRYSGHILGVNSTSSKKTYPSIEIVNVKGAAFVVVSCVTRDEPYRPHPHNLLVKGKETSEGICYFKLPPNRTTINFPNLSIQFVKKKNIDKSLEERERLKVDPFKTGFSHRFHPDIIDLSCVRLCFQVFLEGQESDTFNIPLDPIVSDLIYNKHTEGDFAICWLSDASASVAGGKIMCILCDKITKDNIKVRFFCEENGWEAIAETTSPHYHKQVAIIFKSPKYFIQDINQPVLVKIQLKRPSDGETSQSVPFQLLPLEVDDHDILKKKRQKLNETPKNLVLRHLQNEAAKNAKLANPSKDNDYCVANNKPWELSSVQMHSVNATIPPSLRYSQINNNPNTLSERLAVKTSDAKLANPSEDNDYCVANNKPWELSSVQMHSVNAIIPPSLRYSQINNNPNTLSERLAVKTSDAKLANPSEDNDYCIANNKPWELSSAQMYSVNATIPPSLLYPQINNNPNTLSERLAVKTSDAKLANPSEDNDYCIANNKPWELSSAQMNSVNATIPPSLLYPQINNNPNTLSERLAVKTSDAKLANPSEDNDYCIANNKPWELSSAQMNSVNATIPPSLLYPQINNNPNTLSERLTVMDNISNNPLPSYDIQQIQPNQEQETDYLMQNLDTRQNSRSYNSNIATLTRQNYNAIDTFNYEVPPHQTMYNELPMQHNNSYIDELLTSIIDDSFSNNLPILGDLGTLT